jgi:hypothetical protein
MRRGGSALVWHDTAQTIQLSSGSGQEKRTCMNCSPGSRMMHNLSSSFSRNRTTTLKEVVILGSYVSYAHCHDCFRVIANKCITQTLTMRTTRA